MNSENSLRDITFVISQSNILDFKVDNVVYALGLLRKDEEIKEISISPPVEGLSNVRVKFLRIKEEQEVKVINHN